MSQEHISTALKNYYKSAYIKLDKKMKNKKLFLDIIAIIILTLLGIILVKTQILPLLKFR